MSADENKRRRFHDIGFEDFRRLARDDSLSPHEKIGFPDSYREGYGEAIFADILRKLSRLKEPEQVVLDIGPGCSDLPKMLIDLCEQKGHQLILVDSKEMLDFLPDRPFVTRVYGLYPDQASYLFEAYVEKVNVILVYSVLQYIFMEGNVYDFLDKSLSLLAIGGQMLLGDIPNISKRKRFFSSETGVKFHKTFMQTDEAPRIDYHILEPHNIDDAVLIGLMMRCRAAGFDSYLMPQAADLPMANRREDMLIERP